MTVVTIWFVWTLVAFFAGVLTHWISSRKDRQVLKKYRQQAKAQKFWGRPIE